MIYKGNTLAISFDALPNFGILTWIKLLAIIILSILSVVLFYPLIPLAPVLVMTICFAVFFPLTEKSKRQIFNGNDANLLNFILEIFIFQFLIYGSLYVLRNIYFIWGAEAEMFFAQLSLEMRQYSIFETNIQSARELLADNKPGRSINSYLTYSYFCFFVPFLYIALRPGKFLAAVWVFGLFAGSIIGLILTNKEYPRENRKHVLALLIVISSLVYGSFAYFSEVSSSNIDEQHIYTSFLYPYHYRTSFFLSALSWFAISVMAGWNIGWFVSFWIVRVLRKPNPKRLIVEIKKLLPLETIGRNNGK